jgi:hypothetical protein
MGFGGRKHATWWSQACDLVVASMRPDPPKDAMHDGYLFSVYLVSNVKRRVYEAHLSLRLVRRTHPSLVLTTACLAARELNDSMTKPTGGDESGRCA